MQYASSPLPSLIRLQRGGCFSYTAAKGDIIFSDSELFLGPTDVVFGMWKGIAAAAAAYIAPRWTIFQPQPVP